jgi:hypothetical protein
MEQELAAWDTDPWWQPKWDIPEKIAIQCAISGGGAQLHNANPNQPRNFKRISEEAAAVAEEGATVIHFDFDPKVEELANGAFDYSVAYTHVVGPLLEKYGREKILPHINCLRPVFGPIKQALAPMLTGLAEMTYIHCWAAPDFVKIGSQVMGEHNIVSELVVHRNTEIEGCERVFLKSGLVKRRPTLWCLLPGAVSRYDSKFVDMFEYMRNAQVMCQRLILEIQDIKALDPNARITVLCAGRASSYLVTVAMILGCDVRVGMEDTVWKYPHSDEMIKNNVETLQWAKKMARMLGREPMTPNEFREANGLKARFDHAESLVPFEDC